MLLTKSIQYLAHTIGFYTSALDNIENNHKYVLFVYKPRGPPRTPISVHLFCACAKCNTMDLYVLNTLWVQSANSVCLAISAGQISKNRANGHGSLFFSLKAFKCNEQ